MKIQLHHKGTTLKTFSVYSKILPPTVEQVFNIGGYYFKDGRCGGMLLNECWYNVEDEEMFYIDLRTHIVYKRKSCLPVDAMYAELTKKEYEKTVSYWQEETTDAGGCFIIEVDPVEGFGKYINGTDRKNIPTPLIDRQIKSTVIFNKVDRVVRV